MSLDASEVFNNVRNHIKNITPGQRIEYNVPVDSISVRSRDGYYFYNNIVDKIQRIIKDSSISKDIFIMLRPEKHENKRKLIVDFYRLS